MFFGTRATNCMRVLASRSFDLDTRVTANFQIVLGNGFHVPSRTRIAKCFQLRAETQFFFFGIT